MTLVELLIVIALIGVLASLGLAYNAGAQAKARDAKRKSELDAVSKALELAKTDSVTYSYPNVGVNNGSTSCCTQSAWGTAWTPYIPILPKDPKNTGVYSYTYATYNDDWSACLLACLRYRISAILEQATDLSWSQSQLNCGISSPVSPHYYVCSR